jgi:hypothetical protein
LRYVKQYTVSKVATLAKLNSQFIPVILEALKTSADGNDPTLKGMNEYSDYMMEWRPIRAAARDKEASHTAVLEWLWGALQEARKRLGLPPYSAGRSNF